MTSRGLLKVTSGLAVLVAGLLACAAGLFVLSRIQAVDLEQWPLRYQFLAGLVLYALGAMLAVQVQQNCWRRPQGEH